MRLVKYNPFNEIDFFTDTLNRFWNEPVFSPAKSQNWQPSVDILSEDDHVVLSVELPGVEKEDIKVNVEDRVLTISGERKFENEEKKDNYYRKECRYGNFKRAFSLSEDLMTDDISADFKNGILKVTLKKDTTKEEVKQITVN